MNNVKDIYLQLLGFDNGWSRGKFKLKLKDGVKMLIPVRKGSHGLQSWRIETWANTTSYYFWFIYHNYGIFK